MADLNFLSRLRGIVESIEAAEEDSADDPDVLELKRILAERITALELAESKTERLKGDNSGQSAD